jgi:hypothetical protein
MGSGIRSTKLSCLLVTMPRPCLPRHEAAKLGWITGGDATAKTNYDLLFRILYSMDRSTTAYAAYCAQAGVLYDPVNCIPADICAALGTFIFAWV